MNQKYYLVTFALFACMGSSQAMAGLYTPLRTMAPRLTEHFNCNAANPQLNLEKLECWQRDGGNNWGVEVPRLQNPSIVTIGGYHACALDDHGVQCWGSNLSGQAEVPSLEHPFFVSASDQDTCAIDASGVHCWGSHYKYPDPDMAVFPKLKHPSFLSMGLQFTCALDDDGVRCWGNNSVGQTNVPALKHPTLVAAGVQHACALDEEGVHCWGDNKFGQTIVPALKQPSFLSASGNETCALDGDGVHCWGDGRFGQTNIPALRNPSLVLVGGAGQNCALDEDGVKCWGLGIYSPQQFEAGKFFMSNTSLMIDPGLLEKPSSERPQFHLDQLDELNAVLSRVSNPSRALYFSRTGAFIHRELSLRERTYSLSLARYLMVKMLFPAILSNESSYGTQTLIPNVQHSMVKIEEELGVNDISHIPATSLTRKVALEAVRSALSVSSEFMSASDREKVAVCMRAVGQSLADPMDKLLLGSALAAIEVATPILQKLSANPKSAFLSQTLQVATGWLAVQR